MSWNKKGEDDESSMSGSLVTVIIAIAVIFIIGSFVFYVIDKIFHKEGDVEACRLDILKAWGSKIFGKGDVLTKIDSCPRGDIKVFNSETNDEINSYISKTVDDCMYKFNYGGLDWTKSPLDPSKEGMRICFICGQFQFEGDSKKNYKDSESLYDYIKNYKLRNGEFLANFIEKTNSDLDQKKGNLLIDINGGEKFEFMYLTYSIVMSHVTVRLTQKIPFLNRLNYGFRMPFSNYVFTNDISRLMPLAELDVYPNTILKYCDVMMN
jgi:hypothetical protein